MTTNEIKYIVKGRDEILILFNDEKRGSVHRERNIFNIEIIRIMDNLGKRLRDDNLRSVIERKECDHIELVKKMDRDYDNFHMISISFKYQTIKLDTAEHTYEVNIYDLPGYYNRLMELVIQNNFLI